MMHAPEPTSAGEQWPVLDALIASVIDTRKQIAAAQAAEARLLARAVEVVADRNEMLRQEAARTGRLRYASDADIPLREVSLELGAAMRASDRTIQSRISDAYSLVAHFPQTFTAWSAGGIDAGHAWAIVRAGELLPEEMRERYEGLALAVAATESPARTTQAVKAIAATLCPEAFADRARAAAEQREVRLYDLTDGMARLIADVPAPLGYAIYDLLTARGRAILALPADESVDASGDADTLVGADGNAAGDRGADAEAERSPEQQRVRTGPSATSTRRGGNGDPRTLDQVRADLLCELLLTGRPGSWDPEGPLASISAQVQVTVPALTLAGDDSGGPALLAGHGPIDPGIARKLAGLAKGWDRVFTDPYTGEPLAVDRYRPSAQIKRYLAARDERCRAPGCTRPAHRCDHDHTIAAADGGCTCHDNLANFCRRHHTCKHLSGWRVRQLGHGVIEWIGPTGRRYLDRPPATVRFVPMTVDASDAPF